MLRISNLKIPLNADEADIKRLAAEKLMVAESNISNIVMTKKSVDARHKSNICYVISVGCKLKNEADIALNNDIEPFKDVEE